MMCEQISKRKGTTNGEKIGKLPKRWINYTAIGTVVPGTRFLPFKTPLKQEMCRARLRDEETWFTPAKVLEKAPNLKIVIDLTQANRYYKPEDFIENGILHHKLDCPGGGALPPRNIVRKFNRIIDSFMDSEEGSTGDGIIGVHCTHGLNRTGYLICKYMVEKYGVVVDEAISAFENARGHKMCRPNYIQDLHKGNKTEGSKYVKDCSEPKRFKDWRKEPSPPRHFKNLGGTSTQNDSKRRRGRTLKGSYRKPQNEGERSTQKSSHKDRRSRAQRNSRSFPESEAVGNHLTYTNYPVCSGGYNFYSSAPANDVNFTRRGS